MIGDADDSGFAKGRMSEQITGIKRLDADLERIAASLDAPNRHAPPCGGKE